MIEAGAYADTLRALGRFLDSVHATEVAITEQEEELHAVWRVHGDVQEARRFGVEELSALRTAAKLYRGLEGRAPRFNASEMLRTVGALLDEMGAQSVAITESSYGYQFSAQVEGKQVSRTLSFGEVVTKAQTLHRR
jgi:hypothetical protein